VIHLFWIGPSPQPKFVVENINLWSAMTKNLFVWGNRETEACLSALNVPTGIPPAMQVDALRVATISNYGGWYVDADIRPVGLIPPEPQKIILVREESKRFCNGAFGGPIQHPFFSHWLTEIEESIDSMWPEIRDVAEISGPMALSRAIYTFALVHGKKSMLNSFAKAPWGLMRFEFEGTKPVRITRIFRRNEILVHVAANSWRSDFGMQRKKMNTFRYIFYHLRQTKIAPLLDLFRILLFRPNLMTVKPWQILILLNLDNGILDKMERFKDCVRVINDSSEIRALFRDLTVGCIIASDELSVRILESCGWIRMRNNRWIRPNVTSYMGNM